MKLFNLILLIFGSCFSLLVQSSEPCKKLIFSGSSDWYPISFHNEEKKIIGHSVTLAKKLASQLDIELEMVHNLPWRRQLNQLQNGDIHFIAAYFNSEREKRFYYSKPFTYEIVKVFQLKKNAKEITKIEDLRPLFGARPKAASLGDEFDSFSKNNENVFQVEETESMFKMLLAKRIDYIITAFENGNRVIESMGIGQLIDVSDIDIARNSVHFIFSKNLNCELNWSKINLAVTSYNLDDKKQ